MLFLSPNPRMLKNTCKIEKTKPLWSAAPINRSWQKAGTWAYLLLPGQRAQWPWLFHLAPFLSLWNTLIQQSQPKCEATSLKNIKYKTLPYSVSNHSIYKFILKKKDRKRYSNSTQFKFFFSSLEVPNGIPETGHFGAMLPSKGLLGRLTVYSCPSYKKIHTWKIWRLCSLEVKWIWNVQVELPHPRQSSTRPSPLSRKFPFLEGIHSIIHAPNSGVFLNSNGLWYLSHSLKAWEMIPFFWVAVNVVDVLLSYRP